MSLTKILGYFSKFILFVLSCVCVCVCFATDDYFGWKSLSHNLGYWVYYLPFIRLTLICKLYSLSKTFPALLEPKRGPTDRVPIVCFFLLLNSVILCECRRIEIFLKIYIYGCYPVPYIASLPFFFTNYLFIYLLVGWFWGRISLCSLGFPRIHYIDWADWNSQR